MPVPKGAYWIEDDTPFELEFGYVLPQVEVAYETWGELSETRDNAILVCPAFSAHCHAHSSPRDPSPGWWEGMIGPGKVFDTERHFVICPSLLGGSYGTTGPLSINPATGARWAGDFPVVSVRDVVALQVRLLDRLGIGRLVAVAGGSLGGMEAIELAVRHPGRVAHVITISGTDVTRPYTAAIRHLGRRAIMLDPDYQSGHYEGAGPVNGLRLARELGTIFYRSREEFNERFPSRPINHPSRHAITFDVQSYLDYQGQKIIGRFDANSYLTMSLAMDLHDIWRGFESREAALAAVDAEFLVVGVIEDRLIPIDEQLGFHQQLLEAGKKSTWKSVSSPIGHDTFLVDLEAMTALIREYLG